MRIAFEVRGVPVGQGRARMARVGRGVRAYTDEKTRRASASFLAQALPYKPDKPLEGALRLRLRFVFPVPASYSKKRRERCLVGLEWPAKRPDLDNLEKLVKDSLNGVFYRDDSQVCYVVKAKQYGGVARTFVDLETMGGEGEQAATATATTRWPTFNLPPPVITG